MSKWGVFLKGNPVRDLQGLTEADARAAARAFANYPGQFEARETPDSDDRPPQLPLPARRKGDGDE